MIHQKHTKKENCRHLLNSLSEYIDGTISDEFCYEIERHLSDCEDCQVVVDTLEKTVSLYRRSAEDIPEVPQDVRERLYKRLYLEGFIQKGDSGD